MTLTALLFAEPHRASGFFVCEDAGGFQFLEWEISRPYGCPSRAGGVHAGEIPLEEHTSAEMAQA